MKIRCMALLAGGAALLLPARTAAQSRPSLEQLLERHVEALGGSEALAALQTLRKSGSYAYDGHELPIVSSHKRAARRREEIEGLSRPGQPIREGVLVVRATDGVRAWSVGEEETPRPRLMTRDRTAATNAEAEFESPLVGAKQKGHRVELIGASQVDGEPTWQLRVTCATGLVENWHIGADDYLPRRRDLEREPGVWHFDDYRPVAGVLLPHWIQVGEPPSSREYLFESIEANPAIDDALFAPPPGVEPPPEGE